MIYREQVLCLFIVRKAAVVLLAFYELAMKSNVTTSWYRHFVVQHNQDSTGLLLDQIQNILVVLILDVLERNTLQPVQFFLGLECMRVKMLLQLFVAKIDAQLFETVELEDFKTKDIQNTNKLSRMLS